MPTALSLSPPLAHVSQYPNTYVQLHINDPLLGASADQRRSFWIDLLRNVSVLELCLAKQAKLSANASANDQASQTNRAKVNEVRTALDGLMATTGERVLPKGCKTVQEALKFAGLDTLFPLASGGVADPARKLEFKPMTVLNQVVILALQLRHDCDLTNHKYMAHQIALLYQSLTGSREDLKRFRPLIEAQFDTVKAACSAPVPEPRLSLEQRQWLYSLTTEILTEALFTSRAITPSQRALDFLRTI